MTDSQLGRALTDLTGRMRGDQHEMTVPALADSIEHLKTFHIGQTVIKYHYIG
ncbi:hypothetical protein D3C78_1912500 [compost metagenome]